MKQVRIFTGLHEIEGEVNTFLSSLAENANPILHMSYTSDSSETTDFAEICILIEYDLHFPTIEEYKEQINKSINRHQKEG